MTWKHRLLCALDRHDYGLPLAGVRHIYVRCIRCGHQSPGVEVIAAREERVNVARRLRLLHGRAQQIRMRMLS